MNKIKKISIILMSLLLCLPLFTISCTEKEKPEINHEFSQKKNMIDKNLLVSQIVSFPDIYVINSHDKYKISVKCIERDNNKECIEFGFDENDILYVIGKKVGVAILNIRYHGLKGFGIYIWFHVIENEPNLVLKKLNDLNFQINLGTIELTKQKTEKETKKQFEYKIKNRFIELNPHFIDENRNLFFYCHDYNDKYAFFIVQYHWKENYKNKEVVYHGKAIKIFFN